MWLKLGESDIILCAPFFLLLLVVLHVTGKLLEVFMLKAIYFHQKTQFHLIRTISF